MRRIGLIISRYLITTIVPYFAFSWLLLSVILFVQQASKFSDTFFGIDVPASLAWQLTAALIPNVIAFTCPMAILVGTIIGLAKMQEDSELVAIRAAGVGTLQIATPMILLGVLLSIFAFAINLKGVPFAASLVRSTALQTAIKKLESPIEPGNFNTDLTGFTVYAKDGDVETGKWKNVFIFNENPSNGGIRIITSKTGSLDTSGQSSELVLDDARVATLPGDRGVGKYVSENIGQARIAIKTKRGELIDRMTSSEVTPEELGLTELYQYAGTKEGNERTEALILLSRRIILSLTPLIFCLLGTVIVLRLNRGGRGYGGILALGVLVGFYLLAFLGEQLARVGAVNVFVGSLFPLIGSFALVLWLNIRQKNSPFGQLSEKASKFFDLVRSAPEKVKFRDVFVDLTTGLRNFDILRNLLKNFLLAICFLSAIFLIFTAFELWKFAGAMDGGVLLLVKYLVYLLPFVYLQIAPSAAMIATIATYIIKSRDNEIVAWTSVGQSVYGLLLPCFALMLVIGAVDLGLQELVLPYSNRLQDSARTLLRNKGIPVRQDGKKWSEIGNRIYLYERSLDGNSVVERGRESVFAGRQKYASDNEIALIPLNEMTFGRRETPNAGSKHSGTVMPLAIVNPFLAVIYASDNDRRDGSEINSVQRVSIFEFSADKGELQTVYRANSAIWNGEAVTLSGNVEKCLVINGAIERSDEANVLLQESEDPFVATKMNVSYMTIAGLGRELVDSDSESERKALGTAIQKRWTAGVLPLVLALFVAPFSFSLKQKGNAAAIGSALGFWLLFVGTTSYFEQLSLNGSLAPTIAVWAPLVIFGLLGSLFLSKVRT